MKIVIAALLGFSTVLGGGFLYVKNTSDKTATSQPTVSVTLPSPQAPLPSPNPVNALTPLTKKVSKHTVNKSRVLYLVDQVDFRSINPLVNSIKELSAKSNDPIYLLIDSPGGSVLDGATLISTMEASSAPVYTVCTRLCASMGAMIHSYGSKRLATDRAILMYHPATAGTQGQVKNMRSQMDAIDRYIEKMVANVVSRSKVNNEEFQKMVAYEIWSDSEDSTARGFNDEIVNLNVSHYPSQETLELADPSESKRVFDIQMIAPDNLLHLWTR